MQQSRILGLGSPSLKRLSRDQGAQQSTWACDQPRKRQARVERCSGVLHSRFDVFLFQGQHHPHKARLGIRRIRLGQLAVGLGKVSQGNRLGSVSLRVMLGRGMIRGDDTCCKHQNPDRQTWVTPVSYTHLTLPTTPY